MKKTRPSTVAAYLKQVPAEQRDAVSKLRALIRRNLPKGYEEAMNWGAITYQVPLERCPDTYNGQPLCYVALAAQKHYLSLYLMTVYGDPLRKSATRERLQECRQEARHGEGVPPLPLARRSAPRRHCDIIAATPVDRYVAAYKKSRMKRARRA